MGSGRGFGILVLVLCASAGACSEGVTEVRFLRSDSYTFSAADRASIQRISKSTLHEVRPLLAALPERIVLTVRPGVDVIAETGETADAMPPDAIMWSVDPKHSGGVAGVTQRWLRATLFHELHHLARSSAVQPRSLVDRAVYEGMATAFERDFAQAVAPWGQYPDNVGDWADEILKLPGDAPIRDWIYKHPDGRRWIGMRVGTYWVNRAIAKSGRSAAQLVAEPTSGVIKLATE